MAPPPPELVADGIAEILLRLPPDEPACLVRASLVCKLWRRILSDSTFPHRYREFHRTPPLLGFLRSPYVADGDSNTHRFVPITARVPLLQPGFGCGFLDCRHGRVLLDSAVKGSESLAVWDPMTGDHRLLGHPDPNFCYQSGAVLCAAAGCNHRDRGCHGGPFLVVIVTTSLGDTMARAWVCSSDWEAGAWSAPASVQLPERDYISIYRKRGVLVGDQIYFLLAATGILRYDLGKHCLTMISLPWMYIMPGILMTTEDGSLGFANIMDSSLHLWARKVDPNGSMAWVRDRVILLNDVGPAISYNYVNIIAFAEGVDILLLGKDASGFMFELKSGRFRKLSKPEFDYYDVFPYMNFYIPDFSSRISPLLAERK